MVRKIGAFAEWAAVIVAAALLFFLAIGPRLFDYRTMVMLTGSMRPGIPPGSVVVGTTKPTSSLRAGDVFTYHIPVADHRVISHRVVWVRPLPGSHGTAYEVQTKGDANNGNDPWTAVVRTRHVWTVRATIPHLGDAIVWLRRPPVQLALRWILPGLLVGSILWSIWVDHEHHDDLQDAR
ncbi:MAG TPA: signal peptidase I [Acidimicrobiales bacterium]|jgi:signal peptidase|nr:signal peptidase I [Acidimicrobiales bacterium]